MADIALFTESDSAYAIRGLIARLDIEDERATFGSVTAVVENSDGGYVAADGLNHRLVFMDRNLNPVRTVGRQGEGPGEYQLPGRLIRDEDEIAVVDETYGRVTLYCRPAYLSKAGGRFGFSFSRALRWIRFFHAIELLEHGARMETVCNRLGFGDTAGWSRFATRLVGRSASRLPVIPLEHWVRKAIDDVYFGLPATGAVLPSDPEQVADLVDGREETDLPDGPG